MLTSLISVDANANGTIEIVAQGKNGAERMVLRPLDARRAWWRVSFGRFNWVVADGFLEVDGIDSEKAFRFDQCEAGQQVPLRAWIKRAMLEIEGAKPTRRVFHRPPKRAKLLIVPQPIASAIVEGAHEEYSTSRRGAHAHGLWWVQAGARALPFRENGRPVNTVVGLAFVLETKCIDVGRWQLTFGWTVIGSQAEIEAVLWG